MLSKKDLIELNKEFHNGTIMNMGSLEYAIESTARSRNWLRSSAIFARSILVDHVFEDGNKRTASAVIMMLMELNKISFHPDSIPLIVTQISAKNITNLRQIERYIRNAVRKS